MECYHCEGGAQNPHFFYKVRIKRFNSDVYEWLKAYPSKGYFQRYYVAYGSVYGTEYDEVQFEVEKVAYLFRLAYSELVV